MSGSTILSLVDIALCVRVRKNDLIQSQMKLAVCTPVVNLNDTLNSTFGDEVVDIRMNYLIVSSE